MLIVVNKLQKPIQKLVKHLRSIFLRKSLMATKANSKPYQISEMELFRKLLLVTETDSESCKTDGAVIKVFVYFGISIAKTVFR